MNEEIPNFQADFLTFLASTKEVEISKLYTFAIDSLIFADKVHTFHWKCDSGFQHTHFETIYEDIRDFADALVETVLSMGVKFKAESKTYTITDDLYDVSNALLKIEAYRDTIIDLESQYSTKISLENLFGDIVE